MQSFEPASSSDSHGMSRVVVVGVDGSEPSKDALRWAAEQAHLTSAELHVVLAWRQPVTYGYVADYSDVDFEARARMQLDDVVAEVLGAEGLSLIKRETPQGHPAQVLIAASAGADLLVVGSRGHGAFAGMLLGSTSQHCVQHAKIPVAVIPHVTR